MSSTRQSDRGPFRDPMALRRTLSGLAVPLVVVAGAAAVNIYGALAAGSRQIRVVTEDVNEQIAVFFYAERINAAAGGNGRYQVSIDNVPSGPDFIVSADTRKMMSFGPLAFIFTTPGVHIVHIECTAAVGNETIAINARMVVEANEFETNL